MGTLLALGGLALLDSTSMGTLVIPVLLVVRRRAVDVGPLAVYFATVCGCYFSLGVLLLGGFDLASGALADVLHARPVIWAKLVLGVALALFGIFAPDPPPSSRSVRQPSSLRPRAMVALGLGAGLTEAATMVPYLAATDLLANLDAPLLVRLSLLAGYCLVMIAPAVLMIAIAARWGDRVWSRMERGLARIERESRITMLWVAAIVGLYLASSAASELGFLG